MKKFIVFGIVASMFLMCSCVESSQKYKNLQARMDSLSAITTAQNQEMESMFSDINDITAGMQSLRDAEHLLTLEAEKENKTGSKSKQQLARLKSDVHAITEAIAGYKSQIAKLESKNKNQSAEFKRMIANLNAELDLRSEKIVEITNQLAATNKELAIKVEEVKHLTQNVDSLDRESKSQKMTITEQDQTLHLANYLIGSRKSLKEAGVISRQGIFCPPIVSSQVENADFVQVDVREIKSIPLNNKKAKVLSVHPSDSYSLETDEEGSLVLKISDENAFWKQTKYLVVMVG